MRRRRQASAGNFGGPSAYAPRQRMTPAFQAVCCSLACTIDAFAKASASLAWVTSASKSPAGSAVLAAALAVAGDQPPAHRAHAVPLRAIDRHRRDDTECRRQHFGADVVAGILHVAGGAREIQLPAARIKIFLALLVGRKRARIVGDL